MYIQAWPDKVIKKEVANLQVVCENKTNGCQWKGSFNEFLVSHTLCMQHNPLQSHIL